MLLAVFAAALPAADVNGKWSGQAAEAGLITLDLKSNGGTLSGTVTIGAVGTNPIPIKEGKIQGGAIEFWVEPEYQGQPTKVFFKGKAAEAEIRFELDVPSQNWGTEFTASRAR